MVAQNFDIEQLEKINQIEQTHEFSRIVSNTSSYIEVGVPVVLAGISLLQSDDALLKQSIYIAASFGVNLAATYAVKHIVHRPRPRVSYPDRIVAFEDMTTNSFPSGHTSAAFNTATSLTLSFPKWYVAVPSYLWASSVGYSRMNLGVHYPSDVFCGAVLGVCSAFLTEKVNDWFWKTQNNKRLLGSEKEFVWY
ncbi:phosphatase PAP2 family protein [Bacteroidia bacterium]|nr:phosphatase PAP2 family protein [Bacteroidia bacterium]